LVAFPPPNQINPAIVTLPVARITTGVLVTFFLNDTVTPAGMFTVVKLKIPLGGKSRTVVTVGLNGPSAPVLPLLNAAKAGAANVAATNATIKVLCFPRNCFITSLLD
jgi:hypothetical protein